MGFPFFGKRGGDDQSGDEEFNVARMVEEAFNDMLLNRRFDCGFDPDDDNAERKGEIDMLRSKMLRVLFVTPDFAHLVEKVAKEVMEHEMSAAWDRGESIDKDTILSLRNLVTHVASDLVQRVSQQAIEPFIATLIEEGRYCKNDVFPSHDFAAAQVPPTE